MRHVVLGLLLACASCADEKLQTDQADQAVVAVAAEGQQDVPLAGSEPLTDWSLGAPVEAPPVDPDLLAAQEKYLARLAVEQPEWIAAGLTDEEIMLRIQEIKREELGE
jgi:hypothetical protein